MGKKNKNANREGAKDKASEYLAKAESDGKLSKKEIKKATGKHGVSMDRVLGRAAEQGTTIGGGAQKAYGIKQHENRGQIDYTPGAGKGMEAAYARMGLGGFAGLKDAPSAKGTPTAQKRGLYAGADKKGNNVYRYGVGQPKAASQPAAPTAAPEQAQQAQTYSPETPSPDPNAGMSWNDRMSQGDSSSSDGSSRFASQSGYSRPDTDPNNPNLYGAIADRGGEYQNRFGRFVDYFDSNASRQAYEVGQAGRTALSRLQATPPKLDDPLSTESAQRINAFTKKIKIK